ncbi:sodium/hydrogen exchanger 9B2-like isoform X2 [Aricia agestis]|uniref:sodium/hydrogen exchanger 9B2-like isoform X2 n=1 Tax=Aricia agestis TaxID=91739 RepID=UPI001C206033|nr:sodium/hydrogen exchanger 9B2-like isoform X2 [Aricia agestis]
MERGVADKNEPYHGKTLTFEIGLPKTGREARTKGIKKINENNAPCRLTRGLPTGVEVKQYTGVLLCGLLTWGICLMVFWEPFVPGGYLFNMTSMVLLGYVFGHTLERYTTIHPAFGMTLIGAICRNFTSTNFLENSTANAIDYHLRRIYPAIILTKGPLGWNWNYIKSNPVRVFSLATIPWTVECLSIVLFAHVLLGYPWYWGLHLGSILASVSPALVVPITMAHRSRGLGVKKRIADLVNNAGGLDTAFTEGMFGVINSAIFFPSPPAYRILKAVVAIFLGIVLGIAWGVLADTIPDHGDLYAPTIRSILLLAGGVFLLYGCGYLGWGGTSGVAIMVCAGVAGTRWARRGWPVNNNPVAEVYKLLWRVFEPMLFVLSGYYLDAVLVRVAMDSLWTEGATLQDKNIAKQHSNIIVIAILLTSFLGTILTTLLGSTLLSQDSKVAPEGVYAAENASQSGNSSSNTLSNIQYIDG